MQTKHSLHRGRHLCQLGRLSAVHWVVPGKSVRSVMKPGEISCTSKRNKPTCAV